MANRLSITPAERVFQCPNCKETISTSAQQCRFCYIQIDRRLAEAAADLMDELNQACSEAADVSSMLSDFGVYGWLVAIVISRPTKGIRWLVRFGAIRSEDPGFVDARRHVLHVVWVSAIVYVLLILFVLASVLGWSGS